MIMELSIKEMIQSVRTIAAEDSLQILDIYIRDDVQITTKEDMSPLTQADMASHHHILNRLKQLTPDIPILSEENASEIPSEQRLSWSTYWLVDPLDGTKEFIAQNGEFTVNIALIENHQPILGVVTVPAKKISYFAAKGEGAFKAGPDEIAHEISVRKCPNFSNNEDEAVKIVTSRRTGLEKMSDFVKPIANYETVPMGSSIKMCLIAEGKADLYPRLGPTSEWDTAAAHCVVNEAGGAIVDYNSQQALQYGTKDSLLNQEFLTVGDISETQMDAIKPES